MPAAIKRTKVHDSLNAAMVRMIPELDSTYGLTPMQYRAWKKPEDTLDNGDPCFIASMDDQGMKKDYIYAPKTRVMKDEDVGYYHLLTQEGQFIAYRRLIAQGPSFWIRCCSCCCCGQRNTDFFEVRRILYNRTICKEPNDIVAARMRLVGAQSGGDMASRFGDASLLPTLTSVFLMSA
mmetsp:Transcript_8773/g.16740  ORF Transcript_8773/g.16740 Transcript_8773/m.16740 type:complete len:179 (-) Transcript_8773:29-565(-)|eukprot:scaffold6506_cov171-Amphora_coffeaeformis.AAC.4